MTIGVPAVTAQRALLRIVVVCVAFTLFVLFLYRQHSRWPFVITASSLSTLAVLLALPIFDLKRYFLWWLRRRYWTGPNGLHLHFDGWRIRTVVCESTLWFCSQDVHRALSLTANRRLLVAFGPSELSTKPQIGTALTAVEIAKLLLPDRSKNAIRLVEWAASESRRSQPGEVLRAAKTCKYT